MNKYYKKMDHESERDKIIFLNSACYKKLVILPNGISLN